MAIGYSAAQVNASDFRNLYTLSITSMCVEQVDLQNGVVVGSTDASIVYVTVPAPD